MWQCRWTKGVSDIFVTSIGVTSGGLLGIIPPSAYGGGESDGKPLWGLAWGEIGFGLQFALGRGRAVLRDLVPMRSRSAFWPQEQPVLGLESAV